MQHIGVFLFLTILANPAFGDAARLKEARQRWLHGNYEEARALYEELGRDAKDQEAAAIGLSPAWQSEGEYDKALEVVSGALRSHASSADLHARHAELLY